MSRRAVTPVGSFTVLVVTWNTGARYVMRDFSTRTPFLEDFRFFNLFESRAGFSGMSNNISEGIAK